MAPIPEITAQFAASLTDAGQSPSLAAFLAGLEDSYRWHLCSGGTDTAENREMIAGAYGPPFWQGAWETARHGLTDTGTMADFEEIT